MEDLIRVTFCTARARTRKARALVLGPVCELNDWLDEHPVAPPSARTAGTADLMVRKIVSDQSERPLEVTDLTITAGSGSLNYRFALTAR